ncbi:type II secretion system secretin GspD, partial [Candidatus Marithioploca araucensis]|nr:type II secretion system secretin GspD [Candidatus Marithioploca araucensis]
DKHPVSAEQLAYSQVPQPAVINPTPTGVPIAELPNTPTESLKEVNQSGKVPTITTIDDQTLDVSELDLSDDAQIKLDFEQVELRQILQILADSLGIAMVIDPTIGGKVTLRTPPDNPLNKKDLWPLLQLLLSDAGVTMEKKGRVYHLKKAPPKLPNVVGMTPETLTTSDSAEVLQVTPLRYIAAASAITVINPLIQPKGRVITLPTLNIIGIITTPQRLARINKLLRIIDADPFLHRGMRLFRLINSKATDVQGELDKILKALYGKTSPTYQVVALERINSVLVVAPPNSGFNDVALWVEILDERSQESKEQIFIYKVKNLEAAKLASTLSNVFKVDDKKKDKKDKKDKKKKNVDQKDKKSPLPTPGSKIPVSAELEVNIVADESTNSLLIRANPRDYRQLLETIYALDQVPKEVMINVVIAEVGLTEATQFGIDWRTVFTGFGSQSSMQSNLEVPGEDIAKLAGFSINYLSGSLEALLNIVASNNEISILSRPSLLVRNNEEASINVGSNEPYLSGGSGISQNQNDQNNNQTYSPYQNYYQDVQYKDTGITIKVKPHINDDGIINLEIESELTLLGPPRTTQNLQSFDQRKIKTFVVVRDGTAIVIGGLIQTNNTNSKQGIPILQDLPIVGDILFSSTNIEDKRTELVLIMVPEIVNPEADNRPLVQSFKQRMYLISQLLNAEQIFIDGWGQTLPVYAQ